MAVSFCGAALRTIMDGAQKDVAPKDFSLVEETITGADGLDKQICAVLKQIPKQFAMSMLSDVASMSDDIAQANAEADKALEDVVLEE